MPGDLIDDPSNASALEDREFAALMAVCPDAARADRIAVGVSGGADSMALVLLADIWARSRGITLTALTVDHGLRAAAAEEAARVGAWLGERGIAHRTLKITCPKPPAGVQRTARGWRFAAFDRWCRDNRAGPVLLAHNREDQAETLWLRIAADSGADGLAAMRPLTRVSGLLVARPLLSIAKLRLIATCRARNQGWVDDPSNQDMSYTRVRLRGMAPGLADSGLGPDVALRITAAMATARAEMDHQCAAFLARHGGVSAIGVAWFEARAFNRLPKAFARILISRLTRAVGGAALPPRHARVARLVEALAAARGDFARTLAGCGVTLRADQIWVYREPAKVAEPLVLHPDRAHRWDNRFEVLGKAAGKAILGALGAEGWRWIKHNDARGRGMLGLDGLPHAARLSIPVIHELDGTVSVPHFVAGDGVRCGPCDPLVVAGFSPDDEWIWPLIAPLEAG